MAHEISLVANMNFVLHKDVLFMVKTVANAKAAKVGTLMLSKGNVEWRPKGNSVYAHQLSWEKLGALMMEKGRKVRKAKRRAKKAAKAK
jgi:hypothetical protein